MASSQRSARNGSSNYIGASGSRFPSISTRGPSSFSRMPTNRSSSSRMPSGSSAMVSSGASGMVSSTATSSMMASDVEGTGVLEAPTPPTNDCCGIPCTTLMGSLAALAFYIISLAIVICTDCKLNRDVIYFIAFLLMAIMAMCSMIGMNMMFSRFRVNFLSMSVSLFYSATAGIIALSLVTSAERGLCPTDKPEGTGLFSTSYMPNWFIWFITLFGLLFQIVSHYFYG